MAGPTFDAGFVVGFPALRATREPNRRWEQIRAEWWTLDVHEEAQ